MLVADVERKPEVLAMIQTAADLWGGVDILVNNAWGGPSFGPVEEKTDEQLAHGFGLAFYGPLWAMQAAFPHMKAQGWGRVVNMCSGAGVNAQIGTLEYNAAKEALRTLTRTVAPRMGAVRDRGQRDLPRRQGLGDASPLRDGSRARGGARRVEPHRSGG